MIVHHSARSDQGYNCVLVCNYTTKTLVSVKSFCSAMSSLASHQMVLTDAEQIL